MKLETSEWLEPLLIALRFRDLDARVLTAILVQSTMTAREVDECHDVALSLYGELPSVSGSGIDWIRVGQLIIEELDMDAYPTLPPAANDQPPGVEAPQRRRHQRKGSDL